MGGGSGERLFRDLCPPTLSPPPYLHSLTHLKFLFSFYSSPWGSLGEGMSRLVCLCRLRWVCTRKALKGASAAKRAVP